MREGWVRGAGWTLATGAMVALSWYGVHTVLAGPGVGGARAEAAERGGAIPRFTDPGMPSAVPAAPSASASVPPSVPPATVPVPSSAAPTHPPATARPTHTAASAARRTYAVHGGRVVFDLGASSATLVSATADPGWSQKVWRQGDQIRVVFVTRGHFSSVSCTWEGHPPAVQTYSA